MSFDATAAGRAILFQRAYPCRVSIKRYRSKFRANSRDVPPHNGPNSRITYRNADGDYTREFGFATPPEALAFAKQWGVERDYLKKGTK